MNTKPAKKFAEKKPYSAQLLRAHVLWALVANIGRGEYSAGQVARIATNQSGHYISEYLVKKELAYLEVVQCANILKTQGKQAKRMSTRYTARPQAIALMVVYQAALQPMHEQAAGVYCDFTRSAIWDVFKAACDHAAAAV